MVTVMSIDSHLVIDYVNNDILIVLMANCCHSVSISLAEIKKSCVFVYNYANFLNFFQENLNIKNFFFSNCIFFSNCSKQGAKLMLT